MASGDFGGALLLTCALLATIVAGARYPSLLKVLLLGLGLRLALVFVEGVGLFVLPGSEHDAGRFYRVAVEYSRMPWGQLLTDFNISEAFVYSQICAVLIKIFGPSHFLLKSFNILLGTTGILLVYLIAAELWGKRRAIGAAWLAALYPFAAFNSATILREEIAIVFFLIGVLCTVNWVRNRSFFSLAGALLGYSGATLFHGGWVAAIFGLLVVIIREIVRGGTRQTRLGEWIGLYASAVATAMFVGVLSTANIVLSSKVGNPVDQITGDVTQSIEERFSADAFGGSAYPDWVATGDPMSQPWLLPARIAYFLFSPMPWDIRQAHHLLGFVGTAVYGWIAFLLWRARSELGTSREAQAVIIVVACVVFVFAIGTTNIGTSLRHRTKVFGALAAVAAGAMTTRVLRRR